ncbi:MAG: phage holin family protein [Balneolaceae bacterium]
MEKESSDISAGIKDISRDVRSYVEKRLELYLLSITEQTSYMIADSIQRFTGKLLLFGGVFFLWMALGFFLGEVMNSNSIGFLISSLPLLLTGLLLLRIKPVSITNKIQSEILRKILQSMENISVDTSHYEEKEKSSE